MTQGQIQLGKNKLTENFLMTLKHHFNTHQNMKISVLKSAGHTKEDLNKYKDEILEKLGNKYSAKVIGFSIFIKRWRRDVR